MPKPNTARTIPGVPDSITRADYVALFEAVGIDPGQTLELSFKANGVYATVFALNDQGARTLDMSSQSINKHSIYIPVKDEA